jgi:predicted nucleic acid-binding protein
VTVYVDTSVLLAFFDGDDPHHLPVRAEWGRLMDEGVPLVTSNYVLLEGLALLQIRFGLAAVRLFEEDVAPCLGTLWVDEELHRAALSAVLSAGRKRLSLVDCASFECMRKGGIRTAFTLDRHFREMGFACVPVP